MFDKESFKNFLTYRNLTLLHLYLASLTDK